MAPTVYQHSLTYPDPLLPGLWSPDGRLDPLARSNHRRYSPSLAPDSHFFPHLLKIVSAAAFDPAALEKYGREFYTYTFHSRWLMSQRRPLLLMISTVSLWHMVVRCSQRGGGAGGAVPRPGKRPTHSAFTLFGGKYNYTCWVHPDPCSYVLQS